VVKKVLGSPVVRIGFVVLAVSLGAWAVYVQRGAVATGLRQVGLLTVLGALLSVVAGLVAGLQTWRSLLASLGSPLPLAAAGRIFFIGQLGKYIPGSVWPVVMQAELAKAQHVPRARSATAAVLAMVITLCAGLLAVIATLPFLTSGETADFRWIVLAAPVLLVGLHPRIINPALGWLLRLARRPPLEHPLTGRAVLVALAWALISWVLLCAHVWLLAVRLGVSPGRAALLAIGGFAFAWTAGFLVVFAPAGAGIREVILVATLTTALDTGEATVIALVSRVLMSLADLIVAGLAIWAAWSMRPRGGVRQGDQDVPAPPSRSNGSEPTGSIVTG
jgi:glycosyltransferase 2 family protein